jgi:hypothetical protein
MNRILPVISGLIMLFVAPSAFGQCDELFFSEYLEGSSNNKAIEVFNAKSTPVNLADYIIYRYNNGSVAASDSLLMQGTLMPGDVFVAGNPSAVAGILAVSDTLHTITFYNGDDAMMLKNKITGDTLDIIGIIGNDPGTNWPVGTGATSEFTLVRQASIQQGTDNWAVGATQWLVFPQNTIDSLGAHSMTPCSVVIPSTVSFSNFSLDVAEAAGNAAISVVILPTVADCSVRVSLSPVGTATAGADFTFAADTIAFSASGSASITYNVPIINDTDVESNEVFTLKIDSIGGCGIGIYDTITITILDDDVPLPVYPIGLLTADADGDGIGDSLNIECEVRGVVYGYDLRGGNGVQFTLRDATGGIGVFTSSATIGYTTVTAGDSLHIIGRVEQFNGLTQMGTLDTIIFVTAGRPIEAPVVVDSLGEFTESEWVKIECVKLVNPTQWTGTGSGFTAQITNGTSTFDLRIDNDVPLYSAPAPAGWFDVTGLGGQFDSSVPRTSGYQILAGGSEDIDLKDTVVVGFEAASLTTSEASKVLRIPVSFAGLNPDTTEVWIYLDATASTATNGQDFTFGGDTLYQRGACGMMATDSISITLTDDPVIEGNETIVIYFAAVVNGKLGAVDSLEVTITDDITDNIDDLLPANTVRMFPNPGSEQVRIESDFRMEAARLLDLTGREVLSAEVNGQVTTLNVSMLPAGIYLMEVTTDQGRWVQKWVRSAE